MQNVTDGKLTEYMTTKQFADFAGVSVRTVRGWTQSGKISSFKKIDGCPQSPTLIWNNDALDFVWERTKTEINKDAKKKERKK